MNYAWFSINCTCLDPILSSIIELSVALQTGDEVRRLHWVIDPLPLEKDETYKDLDPKSLHAHYEKKNVDPMNKLMLASHRSYNYLFNSKTLQHSGVDSFDVLIGRTAIPAAKALSELAAALSCCQWVPVGHGIRFVADQIRGWAARVDGHCSNLLEQNVGWSKALDTVSFFKVVAALRPTFGMQGLSLKDLASSCGHSIGTSTESKLSGLLDVCSYVTGTPHAKAVYNVVPS